MPHLVLSCSLSATSRSHGLATALSDALRSRQAEVELVDLRRLDLPFCDAGNCYEHPQVIALQQQIASAASVTMAVPIYNFETGGAARNLVALTGRAWTGKVVGFVAAAGGERSYMSVMPMANSLMLDFRCLVIPRFVYASASSFDGAHLHDEVISERIDELASELVRVSRALATAE
jgi:NAD(P)H-dependent FMN reductase